MLSNLTLCRLHWYPKNQQAIVKADFEYEGVKYTNQRASLNGAAFRALEAVPNKEDASAPKIAHLAISLHDPAGVWISLGAFESTPRPPDGLLRCSPVACESARVISTTPRRRVPWPSPWLAFARRAAIAPCDRPSSTDGDLF